jgi:hypothetical protein
MNLYHNQIPAKKNGRLLYPPSFSASIEPIDLINSFIGSMVLLLLLLPINESGKAPTHSTAEQHFLQKIHNVYCILKEFQTGLAGYRLQFINK